MSTLLCWSTARRVTGLIIATVALAGCVVVPPPWHPYRPVYGYYYR
jgi:hypothetical protein